MTYEQLLQEIAINDQQYVVMTAENRALVRNLPKVLGDRFIDTGITEQTLMGAAAGLALRGRKPIVHALAAFLTMRAFEFTRTSIGIPHLPVKMSSFIPGFLSDGNGPTHQAIEDISIMRGIPGMEVFAPADEDDLVKMLPAIWETENPSYVRINTTANQYKHSNFELGKAEIISEGEDVTILTYGFMFENSYQAMLSLREAGFDVGLVNVRSLHPFDVEMLKALVGKTQLIVTIEDHFLTGGLFSIVAEQLVTNHWSVPVKAMALEARWFRPGRLLDVIEFEGFDVANLVTRISTLIQENQ